MSNLRRKLDIGRGCGRPGDLDPGSERSGGRAGNSGHQGTLCITATTTGTVHARRSKKQDARIIAPQQCERQHIFTKCCGTFAETLVRKTRAACSGFQSWPRKSERSGKCGNCSHG